jgi:cardiolipin synthase
MKEPQAILLDCVATLALELSPSTVSDLANRLRALPSSAEAYRLRTWSSTSKTKHMVDDLINVWSKIPELDPQDLSLALLSANNTAHLIFARQSIDLICTGPGTSSVPIRRTDQALFELIEKATSDILIVSFVAYKVERVVESLRRALQRGVDVKIILEIAEEIGGKVSFDVIDSMSKAVKGAKIYYWPVQQRERDSRGEYGSLHAKCAVSDHNMAIVSSANITGHALELNMELGVLVQGGPIPQKISSHFEELILRNVLIEVI